MRFSASVQRGGGATPEQVPSEEGGVLITIFRIYDDRISESWRADGLNPVTPVAQSAVADILSLS